MKRLFISSLALILLAAFAAPCLAERPAAVSTPSSDKASTDAAEKDQRTKTEKSCCPEKSYKFSFSGYFKGDAVHDLNRTYPGNFVLWVPYGGLC